jgi:hypothetical protein
MRSLRALDSMRLIAPSIKPGETPFWTKRSDSCAPASSPTMLGSNGATGQTSRVLALLPRHRDHADCSILCSWLTVSRMGGTNLIERLFPALPIDSGC